MTLKYSKLSERAVDPRYAHYGEDACFDLSVLVDDGDNEPSVYSASRGIEIKNPVPDEDRITDAEGSTVGVRIRPGHSIVFKTGLAFEIEPGYVMKVYTRSSTGIKKHLALDNGTGIIDSGYRGQVHIGLHNFGTDSVSIYDGDRIAQAEICKMVEVTIEKADALSASKRGEAGIGSTGH